ncbi:MAG: carbohydrate ABC transporter permease [Candidatus Ventricola sp.]
MPAILGFLLFTAGPMLGSLFMSFTDYSVAKETSFIGLDNYIALFSGEDIFFWNSVKVTIIFALCNVPACLLTAFVIAMLLNTRKLPCLPLLRAIFYVPTIIPIIATAMIFMWMMSPDFGLFNYLLEMLGLQTSYWIYDEKTVLPSLLLMTAWGSGNIMVVFLAALQGIPSALYEAIEVDGGGMLHKFRHITVPMMTPTIFFNMVMFTVSSLQAFLQAYIMTQGGPLNSTNYLVYHLYRTAFEFMELGRATAIGWVLFVIIAAVVGLLFWSSRFWVVYGDEA